jgi:hypothetical protein
MATDILETMIHRFPSIQMKLIMAMISHQLFYLSGSMSVALNKTICLFIEKHSNISHSIQIQKRPTKIIFN